MEKNSLIFNEKNTLPPLTKEEELKIAKKAKKGDKEAFDILIKSNIRFVLSIAKKFKIYSDRTLEFEDIVSYGYLGLCKAFDKFDPNEGFKFISYAVWWIRQSILQALVEKTNLIKLPKSKTTPIQTFKKQKEKLQQELLREVSVHEIMESLGLDKYPTPHEFVSIDTHVNNYDDGNSMKRELKDEGAENLDENLLKGGFELELTSILSKNDFTNDEKEVILQYYGFSIHRSQTLEEIGVDLGVCRERIRQIKESAIEKLKRKGIIDKILLYMNQT